MTESEVCTCSSSHVSGSHAPHSTRGHRQTFLPAVATEAIGRRLRRGGCKARGGEQNLTMGTCTPLLCGSGHGWSVLSLSGVQVFCLYFFLGTHPRATSPSAPLLSAPEVGAVDNDARQTHSELNGSVCGHCEDVSDPSAGPWSSFSECWWQSDGPSAP